MISAGVIITLAYIFKTKNVEMFGYLILGSVVVYGFVGRRWVEK